jgi:cytochrome c peroxidase
MHDGSIGSLSEAIEHYARGGRLITDGPYAGDGSRNPYRSEFVRGFELSEQEKSDLIAFLEALTDESALVAPEYSNPF